MRSLQIPSLLFLGIACCIAFSCSKSREISKNPDQTNPTPAIVYKLHQIDSIGKKLEEYGYHVGSYTANKDSSIVTFTYSEQITGAEKYGVIDVGISPADVRNPKNAFPSSILDGREFLKNGEFTSNPEIAKIKPSSVKVIVTTGNGTPLSGYTIPSPLSFSDYINPLGSIIGKADSALLVHNRSKLETVSGNYTKIQDIKGQLLFNNSDGLLMNMDGPPHFPNDAVSDMEDLHSKSGTYVFFRQDYAQVTLDESAFKLNLTSINTDSLFYMRNHPVYVSSLICGNYGLIVFESMDDANDVLDAVNTLLRQDSSALTTNQKAILNRSKSRTFYRSYALWNKGFSGTEKLTQIKNFFDPNTRSSINLNDATLTTYVKMRTVEDRSKFEGGKYTYKKEFQLK